MQATANPETLRSISLTNTNGVRNAEYHCQLIRVSDNAYQVNYQYGRIGSALRPGCKPATPVALDKAQKAYDKLVAEKKGEGYVEKDAAKAVAAFAESTPESTFQSPQLLNEITREEATRLIDDGNWLMQEKKDGKRLQVKLTAYETKISNKLAKACSIPKTIVDQLKSLTSTSVPFAPAISSVHVDAELVGNTLHIFDVLELDEQDLRNHAFELREETYRLLINGNKTKGSNFDGDDFPNLEPVETYYSAEAKRAAFDRIEAEKGEGVVFKLRYERYTAGRPSSGGPALKFKFREASTCICLGETEGKRSIRLGMLDESSTVVNVGSVTVPPNMNMPQPGDLVDVEYLYKFEGGSLFQPVLKRVRDDVLREECTLGQVKRTKEKQAPDNE